VNFSRAGLKPEAATPNLLEANFGFWTTSGPLNSQPDFVHI